MIHYSMNITLCGSIAFIDEMDAVREELEGLAMW